MISYIGYFDHKKLLRRGKNKYKANFLKKIVDSKIQDSRKQVMHLFRFGSDSSLITAQGGSLGLGGISLHVTPRIA